MYSKKQSSPAFRQAHIYRIIYIFLCMVAAMHTARAQQLDTTLPLPDPRYLAALADTCRPLVVLENTVVQFNGYARAYIRVSGFTSGSALYYRAGSIGAFTQSQLQNTGVVLLNHLMPNTQYEVWANDNCGTLTKIAAINTQTGDQQEISVSEAFFDAMVRHAKEGMRSSTFWEYLKHQSDVSNYEKLSYAQQFYLRGEPLDSDNPEDFYPPQLDTCICKWYLNPTQSVSLGTQVPNVPDDHAGTIIQRLGSLPKTEVASYAAYWGINNNKGPAKYHQLWMEGYKAPKDQLHVHHWSHFGTNTASSTQFARLRVNLHCQNNQDPEACQCRKTYRFYYRYDTDVAAHTHLVDGGLGDKKAVSAVEDAAVVTYRNEVTNERELIAAGRARAKSECQHIVNDEFWLGWIEFARVVVNVLLDPNSIDTTDVNQVAASLSTLVTTDHYEASNCSTADTAATLFEFFKEKDLAPNQPIEVKLYSFDHLLMPIKLSPTP